MDKLAELKPRLRLYGDTDEALGYMGAAMSLLHQTLAVAKSAGVPAYRLTNTLPDGTQVHAEVYGEQTAVSIVTRGYQDPAIEPETDDFEPTLILVTIIGASLEIYRSGYNLGVYSSFAFDPKSMRVVYQDFLPNGSEHPGATFTAPQNVVSFANEIVGFPVGKAATLLRQERTLSSGEIIYTSRVLRITAPDLYSMDMSRHPTPPWRVGGRGLLDKPAGIAVYRWETVRVLHDENGVATNRAIVAASTTVSRDLEPYRRRVDRLCVIELRNMRVLTVKPVSPFYILHTSNEHKGSILYVTGNFNSNLEDDEYDEDNFDTMGIMLVSTSTLEVTDSAAFPTRVYNLSPVNACTLNDSGAVFVTERPVDHIFDEQKPGTQYTVIAINYGPGVFGRELVGPVANNADANIDASNLPNRYRLVAGGGKALVPWDSDRFKCIDITQHKRELFYAKTYAEELGVEYYSSSSRVNPWVKLDYPGYAFEIGRVDAQTGRFDASHTFVMKIDPKWAAQYEWPEDLFWNRSGGVYGEVGKTLQMNVVEKRALSPYNLLAPDE